MIKYTLEENIEYWKNLASRPYNKKAMDTFLHTYMAYLAETGKDDTPSALDTLCMTKEFSVAILALLVEIERLRNELAEVKARPCVHDMAKEWVETGEVRDRCRAEPFVGMCCQNPLGHTGDHRNGGIHWANEENKP